MTDLATDSVWLDYKEAAARVRKSEFTIRRWSAAGMPMVWGERSGQRARLVDEEVLLAWWRQKLMTAPVEYYRRRRRFREDGLPDPEPPASLSPSRRTGSTPSATGDSTSPVDEPAEHGIDWTSIGTLRRGETEWAALVRALENRRPACAGRNEYLLDRVGPALALDMEDRCDSCPVFDQCRAFAEASRPPSGFWAGEVWPRAVRAKR